MTLFRRLFRTSSNIPDDMEKLTGMLEGFITTSLAHVDRVALDGDPMQQQRVMAYFFGTIQHLAHANDLDETHTLALMVTFLNRYISAATPEIGSVTALRQKFGDSTEGHALMLEGSEMLRRWLAGNDPAAVQRLRELLLINE